MRISFALSFFGATALASLAGCNAALGNEDGILASDASVGSDAGTAPAPRPPPVDAATRPPPEDAAPAPPPQDDAGTGASCVEDQKLCAGACVAMTDPVFGCAANACSPCVIPRATAGCAGGGCAVATCNPGYADCDGNAANGCETDLSQPTHCGACNAACASFEPVCAPTSNAGGFACATGCTAVAPTLCGNQCVDLQTSATHCGDCSVACPAVTNGIVSCAGGKCQFACNTGFHACGAACVSNSDPATCGTSCAACPGAANGNATCSSAGQCGIACTAGFHLCAGVCASNASPATCGASCAACVPPANATSTCDGTNCGFACSASFHMCGGACVSNTSIATCGAACTACVPPANATSTCDGTNCGFGCNTGYHACGAACASNTATASCGTTSCTACVPPANATSTCNGLACGFACTAPFADCDGNPANGCEVNTSSDPAHCGSCTMACPAMQMCTGSACH